MPLGARIRQLRLARGWKLEELPAIAAREPAPPHHPPPGWLFTAELFQALQHRKPAELRHIEAIIRAHLQLPPLQADAGNRAAA